MSAPDKITAAREKYNSLIAQKRAEISELEKKLNLLSEIEKDMGIEKPIIRFNLNPSPEVLDSILPPLPKPYANMRLIDAAESAVKILAKTHIKDITRAKVARYMVDRGFVPKGRNFLISVDVALRRMAEAKKISSTLKDGQRTYGPIDDQDTT